MGKALVSKDVFPFSYFMECKVLVQMFFNERLNQDHLNSIHKIYRGRPKRLIDISQSIYIDKVLNKFNIQILRRDFCPYVMTLV